MAAQALDPKAFRRKLKDYEKKVREEIIVEAHGVVVREVFKRILERTPVLTGRARRNWNLSFNAPNPETTEEVAGVTQTGTPWTAQERQRAQDVLRNIKFAKVGSTIWIGNFLPYIQFLEEGSSMKAPNGIVVGAIQGALEELRSTGIKSKSRG